MLILDLVIFLVYLELFCSIFIRSGSFCLFCARFRYAKEMRGLGVAALSPGRVDAHLCSADSALLLREVHITVTPAVGCVTHTAPSLLNGSRATAAQKKGADASSETGGQRAVLTKM